MSLRIVIISDTHTYHRKVVVPDGDVLIHCGDITNRGELSTIKDFSNWLRDLPHKNKTLIFGNHELNMENGPHRNVAINMITDAGATYLENSGAEIEGLKFWGSPVTPRFFDWEWNVNRGKDIAAIWKKIPDDINILITHGPSYGVLDLVEDNLSNMGRDLHQGCEELAKRIKELKNLKLHCCGHLHTDGGKQVNINGVTYANAAICTEQYRPINNPVIIDL
jgi:Icc-related predicted phosphoesterase